MGLWMRLPCGPCEPVIEMRPPSFLDRIRKCTPAPRFRAPPRSADAEPAVPRLGEAWGTDGVSEGGVSEGAL